MIILIVLLLTKLNTLIFSWCQSTNLHSLNSEPFNRGSWKDNQILAQPVPVYTDFLFAEVYVRAELVFLVATASQLLSFSYEFKRGKWEWIIGYCKFQWIIYLSLSSLCALHVCKAGHINTIEWGLVGKVSKKLAIFDCSRERTKFCSLSTFIKSLILVIIWDFKGSDSYGW